MIFGRNYFMSKLKKERLNQMIENALSFKQEAIPFKTYYLSKSIKNFIIKPNVFGLVFSSLLISLVLVIPIISSRNLVDLNEINDYITFKIIDDM